MIDIDATDKTPCIRRRQLWRKMVAAAFLFNASLFAAAAAVADTSGKPMKIVAFGDSLSAGYQLPPGDSFPAQLQKALNARGHKVEVGPDWSEGRLSAASQDGVRRKAAANPRGMQGYAVGR